MTGRLVWVSSGGVQGVFEWNGICLLLLLTRQSFVVAYSNCIFVSIIFAEHVISVCHRDAQFLVPILPSPYASQATEGR